MQSGSFSRFSQISQKSHSQGGGMLCLFEMCKKRPVWNGMGLGGGDRRPHFEIQSRTLRPSSICRVLLPLSCVRAACSKTSHGHCCNMFPLHLKVKSGHFVQFDVISPKMKVVRLY